MTDEDQQELVDDLNAIILRAQLQAISPNASEEDRLRVLLKVAAATVVIAIPGDRNQNTDRWAQIFRNYISENYALKSRNER